MDLYFHLLVHIQHEHNGHNADVSFTMPKFGYNIKPEEKETYDAAVKSHKGEPDEEFHSGYGISAVRDKHGTEAMERVAKASGSFQTFRGNGGEAKHHTFGMFATVKKIIHEHGKSNPHIRAFTFSSSTSSPSRLKLYSKIAQRHGGEGSGGQYEIPNPHYKYKPLSDDAQSLLAHAGFWQGE